MIKKITNFQELKCYHSKILEINEEILNEIKDILILINKSTILSFKLSNFPKEIIEIFKKYNNIII